MNALDRWTFAPSDRYQLGIFRVLFVAWLAHDYVERILPRLVEHASRPHELLAPVSLVRWLGLPALVPESWLLATRVLAAVLLAAACAGVFTRAALVALAALNLWLGAVAASWGYTSHATALPALVLVVIACAPGVRACSVDAWLEARKAAGVPRSELVFGRRESIWPVRCVLLLLCLFYFASGYAKLRYAGPDWADGRTLAFYLEGGSRLGPNEPQRFFASEDAPPAARFRDGWGLEDYVYVARPTALGRALSRSRLATRALSVFTLFVELGFPLALLGRRLLVACLALGVAFHLGIEATLRIDFTSYLSVYLLFVDWKSLLQRFARLEAFRKRNPSGGTPFAMIVRTTMSKTLPGLFDTEDHAARAAAELLRRGVPHEEIAVVPVIAAKLELDGEKQRRRRARAALLLGGIGTLAGALLAVVALRLDAVKALQGAVVGAVLGAALGLTVHVERRAARGGAMLAVRTADSKLARIAKRTLSREALDYTFEGTTVARS